MPGGNARSRAFPQAVPARSPQPIQDIVVDGGEGERAGTAPKDAALTMR